MKLCTFETGPGETKLGVESAAGMILDAHAVCVLISHEAGHANPVATADALVPAQMLALLHLGASGRDAIAISLAHLGPRVEDTSLRGMAGERLVYELPEVRLLAPLPRPNSIRDCLAFEEHLKSSMGEANIPKAWYEFPVYYKGNPDTVQGTGADVIWPRYTNLLDYELEFAAVIGREGVDISKADALGYIAGYTVFNDVSARDIQMKEMSCMLGPAKGKDMDGGNILGPFLVTADEWDPRGDHVMTARVNGEEWSRGLTSSMYHDFATIVSYISQGETLHVGDVIGSGTVGTGCGLELKKFPKPGDVIELEVEGLGVLTNRFVKPA
jgi:2-keto-4-pentenoate hydratase/2-oxohepta-3-ene-1,7-dioic acid hydratase in catechol pathway